MKYEEKIAVAEGFYELKHNLKGIILSDYEVPIEDRKTLRHYFSAQQKMDHYICQAMGWGDYHAKA